MNRFRSLLGGLLGWEFSLIILVGAALLIGGLLSPDFLTSSNISFLTANFSEVALMALAMTLLIIVGVGLETVKQIDSQLQQRHYEGILK